MSSVHGSCVEIGGAGVLIRGAPGSGKSTLVHLLLAAAEARGRAARLIADDRVMLARRGGRIVARPHPALRGLIEIRGLGIVRLPYDEAAVVRLLVDIVAAPDMVRLPDPTDETALLLGLSLPRVVAAGAPGAVAIVLRSVMSTTTLAFAPRPAANQADDLPAAAEAHGVVGRSED
jgi:serine kinase of HPr protein (carbohydrate metabolism regulator)